MVSYIPLTKGRVALIDTGDYERLVKYQWMCHSGYARRVEHGQTIHMHRMLLGCPSGFEVDHINRNKLDNRRCNLRIVTRQQNMCNKARYKGSSSAYKGVSWHSQDKIWHAQIRKNGKIYFLGAYVNEIDAASAYNYYARLLFGNYAVLNDVKETDFLQHRFLKKVGRSKYRGVTYSKKREKWVARITLKGKRITLGYFDIEKNAAQAYNDAFIKYGKGIRGPNFI